jgi:hypothetical protein
MSMRRVVVWGLLALVLLGGCASTLPDTVFQPREMPGVQSFFRNGAAIAAISGDSVFALSQVEPVTVGNGAPYARLWLLVENHSSKPLLVEPLKCASLRVESTGMVKKDQFGNTLSFKGEPLELAAASPTAILASVTNAQATASILNSIGAALEAGAQRPTTANTTVDGKTYTTTVNDVDEKRQAIIDRRASRMTSSDAWYEAFKASVNAGILRRNTLFPGEGVNGYIYFKVPMTQQPPQPIRRYVVTLRMPEGEKVATFEPIEGE